MMRLVEGQRREGHLHPASGLPPAPVAASLGHELLAAMVHVDPAVGALHALLDQPVQERAAVVTPGGLVVRGGLELVGAWLLYIISVERKKGSIQQPFCWGHNLYSSTLFIPLTDRSLFF